MVTAPYTLRKLLLWIDAIHVLCGDSVDNLQRNLCRFKPFTLV